MEQGFIALEPDGRPRLGAAGRFRPPADWNSRPNEWIFLYARCGRGVQLCRRGSVQCRVDHPVCKVREGCAGCGPLQCSTMQ